MLKKIKAFLVKMGFDLTGKTDAEIKTMAEEEGLIVTEKEPEGTEKEPKHNSDIIKELRAQNAQLTALADTLKADKDARDAETQAQAANALKAKINAEILQAKKDGRLPAGTDGEAVKTQTRWAKMLEADFDTAKDALDGLSKSGSKQEQTNSTTTNKTADQPNTLVGSGVSPKIMAYVNGNVPLAPVSNN